MDEQTISPKAVHWLLLLLGLTLTALLTFAIPNVKIPQATWAEMSVMVAAALSALLVFFCMVHAYTTDRIGIVAAGTAGVFLILVMSSGALWLMKLSALFLIVALPSLIRTIRSRRKPSTKS